MPNFEERGPEVVRTNVGTGDEKETTYFPNGVSSQWSPLEWRSDFDPEGKKSGVGYIHKDEEAHRFGFEIEKGEDGTWNSTIRQHQPHPRSLGITSPHMYHDSGVIQISDEPIKYGNKMSLSRSKIDQFIKLDDGRTIVNPGYKDIRKDWQKAVTDVVPVMQEFQLSGYKSADAARAHAEELMHQMHPLLPRHPRYGN